MTTDRNGPSLVLSTGMLALPQLNLLLGHLPLSITFIDENDIVAYHNGNAAQIFGRSPTAIGRNVRTCHPHRSLDMVERVLADLRSGARAEVEFYFTHEQRFVHIRYIAVRDVSGEYRGCLEVMQDATRVRALEGERRTYDGTP